VGTVFGLHPSLLSRSGNNKTTKMGSQTNKKRNARKKKENQKRKKGNIKDRNSILRRATISGNPQMTGTTR